MPDRTGTALCRPRFLQDILHRHPPSPTYWIAFSGGLDSTVLLHLCAELQRQQPEYRFAAIHVHHGLQPAAEAWAAHCGSVCERLGIPLRIQPVKAEARHGQSPEEAARNARYNAFRALIGPGDAVLTAQHLDDQAETLLLQLFRGAGLAGLAAMPEWIEFSPGYLMRPLLGISREGLQAYAEIHRLDWVEDPSNRDEGYDRNLLRNRIMPLLKQRWPSLTQSLSRSARHCAEAHEALESRARALLAEARHPQRNTLLIEGLRELLPHDQRLVLRAWLKASGFRMPSTKVLERMIEQGLNAAADRNPAVRWPEGEVHRYRRELHLMPPLPRLAPGARLEWANTERLRLPEGNGELIVKPTSSRGIPGAVWQAARIRVGYREGGEKIRLAGRDGSHALKKLYQEAGIPPWLRERMPLIYLDDRLAAVGGLWLAAEWSSLRQEPRLALEWIPPPGLELDSNPRSAQGLQR
jgi:tRNA(Ile)-lysidine synthase